MERDDLERINHHLVAGRSAVSEQLGAIDVLVRSVRSDDPALPWLVEYRARSGKLDEVLARAQSEMASLRNRHPKEQRLAVIQRVSESIIAATYLVEAIERIFDLFR